MTVKVGSVAPDQPRKREDCYLAEIRSKLHVLFGGQMCSTKEEDLIAVKSVEDLGDLVGSSASGGRFPGPQLRALLKRAQFPRPLCFLSELARMAPGNHYVQ